jgi:hypothetical protein
MIAQGVIDIANWLRTLNLGQYEAAFCENSVTVDLLSSLTPDDLKDLGITAVGHRAATMLARFRRRQGDIENARELLRPVYGRFTEGFDTADLKEAKALLDEMD